jgi:hypothetical protein
LDHAKATLEKVQTMFEPLGARNYAGESCMWRLSKALARFRAALRYLRRM